LLNRCAILVVFLLAGNTARAEVPPTVGQLSQMLDDQDYHGAVAGVNRAMSISAGGAIDRGLLISIRGEANLQLNNYPAAAEDFATAAGNEVDPTKAAMDKANEILIKKSAAGIYSPKIFAADVVSPPVIDIHLRAGRAAVYPVLFRDEWAAAQIELKQAKSTHEMNQLLTILEKTAALRQLEWAASGKDARTHPVLQELADHAYDLMTAALSIENQKVSDDKARAEMKVKSEKMELVHKGARNAYSAEVEHLRSAGLSPLLVSDLKGILSDCAKIAPAAKTVGKYWEADKKWSPIVAEADRISTRAREVLSTEYDTADKHDEVLLGK
jgi:hypothetical protein